MNWYHWVSDFGYWVFFPIFKQNQMFPIIAKDFKICNRFILLYQIKFHTMSYALCSMPVSGIALPQTFRSPCLCSGCFLIWNTQFSPPKSPLIRLTRRLIWAPFSASCPLHPQRSPSQPLEHTVFVFSTNLRSGRISRTKHLKMKCWMKEWMVLNTTCSLNDNGEKFIGSQLKPKKTQNSWLQLDMGCFYFLATMNNAALNISVQFLWMGTLSWVYT